MCRSMTDIQSATAEIKAKFHYASWFGAGSELQWFEAGSS